MKNTVYENILAVAESLIQSRGYNAFSYKDIAQSVGIKTSSIHYYFPTKADLVKEVVQAHLEKLRNILTEISNDNALSARKKLMLFFDTIIAATYGANGKMCLGGILASEISTLPKILQLEVRLFFKDIEEWLILLLRSGAASGEFSLSTDAKQIARLILTLLEGSLLLARLFKDEESLKHAKQHILNFIRFR